MTLDASQLDGSTEATKASHLPLSRRHIGAWSAESRRGGRHNCTNVPVYDQQRLAGGRGAPAKHDVCTYQRQLRPSRSGEQQRPAAPLTTPSAPSDPMRITVQLLPTVYTAQFEYCVSVRSLSGWLRLVM